jgi:hypothetical protein
MTPPDAVLELLARVGASKGAAVLVSEEELSHWPAVAVQAMKLQKLLVKASPASSTVCPGCEQECVMPVHTLSAGSRGLSSFIVCDKRDDINRVAVPIHQLEHWQTTGSSIAELLAGLLELRRPDSSEASTGRWEVGVLKSGKGSSHLVLLADAKLTLTLGGHSLALADVLTLENKSFMLDKRTLTRLVDKPVSGAGDVKSAMQRYERLMKRVQAEKNKGNRAFLKTVAEEEAFSVSRLKQILQTKSTPAKRNSRRSL